MRQDNKISKGKLVVPSIVAKFSKVEVPAVERFAKKGAFIFQKPPYGVKKLPHLPLQERNMDSFDGVIYLYRHLEKIKDSDIPQKSPNAIVLHLNEKKLNVRFYEEGRLSTYRLEMKLSPDKLAQLKTLPTTPKRAVDLAKNSELLNPIIWEALKQGKRLNSRSFGYNLGALRYDSKCFPLQYFCAEKTEVVARLFDKDSDTGLEIYEVRVIARNFTEQDSSRPEETEESDTFAPGFMLGVDLESPHKVLIPSLKALFTTEPRVDQTRQKSFGNCFLLAAIKCICSIPEGKDFILRMMKQDEQGVSVRFYQEVSEGKCKPVYKRVPNAIVHHVHHGFFSTKKPISSHLGGLWLHALENAYAILDTRICPSYLGKYGHGGLTQTALQAITGNPAKDYPLKGNKFPKFGEVQTLILAKIFSEDAKEPGAYRQVFNEILPEDSLLYYLFDHNEENMILFVKELRQQLLSGHALAGKINQLLLDFDETERSDQKEFEASLAVLCQEISKFLPEIENSPVYEILKKAIDLSQPKTSTTKTYNGYKYYCLGGPELSGKYSLTQVQTYDHIKTNLEAGKLITAASLSEVKMPEGLASSHGYAVVGFKEEKNYLYIIMRNPWGYKGLKYKDNEGSLFREINPGEISRVELADFFKFFEGYQIGTLPKVASLGLKNTVYLDQQIKADKLEYIYSSLEAGFLSYGLLPAGPDEKHKKNEKLTDLQQTFIKQELDSYTGAFAKFIHQRLKVLDKLFPLKQYLEIQQAGESKLPGLEDTGAFITELMQLLDPTWELELLSSPIGSYLFFISQSTDYELQDYGVEILNLIKQVTELQNLLNLLKADTQFLSARLYAGSYLNVFKKIIDSVAGTTDLGSRQSLQSYQGESSVEESPKLSMSI